MGNITEVTRLGDYGSGHQFYHRLSDPTYHTLIIHSDVIAFHETTNGPFNPEDTIWAPWSPDSNNENGTEGAEYLAKIRQQAEEFTSRTI
jgi:hypothetical protein